MQKTSSCALTAARSFWIRPGERAAVGPVHSGYSQYSLHVGDNIDCGEFLRGGAELHAPGSVHLDRPTVIHSSLCLQRTGCLVTTAALVVHSPANGLAAGDLILLTAPVEIVIRDEIMVMFYDLERDEDLGLTARIARKITSIKNSSNTKFWCAARV